jgi:hypothetical protein
MKQPSSVKRSSKQPAAAAAATTLKIPDTFNEQSLASALSQRLAGSPANGAVTQTTGAKAVIWVDRGDEVLVHLDSVRTKINDRMLLVSVDLETDQTGRSALVVALALGNASDPAGLIATTDELPRGNGMLAARWGKTLQNAVWGSLLAVASAHASERLAAPVGISAAAGVLQFNAGTAPVVAPRPGASK